MNNINEAIKIQLRFYCQLRWVTEVLRLELGTHEKQGGHESISTVKTYRIPIFILLIVNLILEANTLQQSARLAFVQNPITMQYTHHQTPFPAVSSFGGCPTPPQ